MGGNYGGGYGYGGHGHGVERNAYRSATPNRKGQYSDAVLNELESQNDEQVAGILGKVRTLKSVSFFPLLCPSLVLILLLDLGGFSFLVYFLDVPFAFFALLFGYWGTVFLKRWPKDGRSDPT